MANLNSTFDEKVENLSLTELRILLFLKEPVGGALAITGQDLSSAMEKLRRLNLIWSDPELTAEAYSRASPLGREVLSDRGHQHVLNLMGLKLPVGRVVYIPLTEEV